MTHESSATMHICELSNNVTSIGFRRSSKNFESIIQFNTVSLECAEANNFFISLYLFFFIFSTTPNLSLFNTQTRATNRLDSHAGLRLRHLTGRFRFADRSNDLTLSSLS